MPQRIPLHKTSLWIETTLKIAVTSTMISLGLVMSIVTVFVPNFEFISLTIFVISFLFGLKYGFFGTISLSILYELIVTQIYGSAGLLFLIKIFCYGMLVFFVGKSQRILLKLSWWELGTIGFAFSLFYDIITTVVGQIIIVQTHITIQYLLIVLVMGFPFTLSHVLTNFVLFSMSKLIIRWVLLAFKYKGIRVLWSEGIMEATNVKLETLFDGVVTNKWIYCTSKNSRRRL